MLNEKFVQNAFSAGGHSPQDATLDASYDWLLENMVHLHTFKFSDVTAMMQDMALLGYEQYEQAYDNAREMWLMQGDVPKQFVKKLSFKAWRAASDYLTAKNYVWHAVKEARQEWAAKEKRYALKLHSVEEIFAPYGVGLGTDIDTDIETSNTLVFDWDDDEDAADAADTTKQVSKRRKNLYLALTTINPHTSGFKIVAAGHNKKAVEDAAYKAIGGGTDLEAETYRKNLRVVSKTAAKRNYNVNWDAPFDPPPGWGSNGEYEWVE